MGLKSGSRVFLTLADGTTLAGTVRWSWRWWLVKLETVTVNTRQGEISADGVFLVPVRSVLMAQVGA